MKFKLTKKVKILLIIGISIVLIGILSYKFYFENKRMFKQNEDSFIASVEEYFRINPLFLPKDGSYKNITLQDMYDKDLVTTLYVPKKTKLCNENNSFVRVTNKNGIYNYNVYLECGKYKSKMDNTSPVLILNGEDKIIVDYNTEYIDAGIKSVVDDVDGMIDPKNVEIISNVDTSKVGNYEVIYKVHDSNFNLTKVTRTVVVAKSLNEEIKKTTNGVNIYKGNVDNNYLLFSGMLFRIVRINEDGSVKIVSDDNIAHLNYNEEKYKDSNLEKWLNDYYYNNLNEESKKYIVKSKWCTGNVIDVNNFSCSDIVSNNVGLLNTNEYLDSFVDNVSYLDGTYKQTLLINKKDNNTMYTTYGIDYVNEISVLNNLPSVRPSFNLNKKIYITRGNGTIDNPYMLGEYKEGKENDKLNERLIGEFVKYSSYIFRIAGITENGNIMLVAMDELGIIGKTGSFEKINISLGKDYKFDVNNGNNVGYLLNNYYIDYLINTYLVEDKFTIPKFDINTKYTDFNITEVTGKIFMPYTYMMFASDSYINGKMINNYLYIDLIEDSKVIVSDNVTQVSSLTEIDSEDRYTVKPVIFINKNAKIRSGNGRYDNPYLIK